MKKSVLAIALFVSGVAVCQDGDKGVFVDDKPGYYQTDIMVGVDEYEQGKKEEKPYQSFKMDFSGMDLPTNPADYTSIWKNNPISQGNTGTCWCFSTTSFYESEVKRISGKEVKLSQIHTVYWEYVERAKYFVQNRGEMSFGEGSETNAVAKIMKMYGVVPHDHFTGMLPGQKFHNHEPMFVEIEDFFASVKERSAWNEDEVVSTVKAILKHYLGDVPTMVKVDGKEMTPQAYMAHLGLVPDDYVNFMSLMELPYGKKGVYDVPDNWWRSNDYYNVKLDEFMDVIKKGVKDGYGISIGGDVSEPGMDRITQVAVIPSFDVPSDQINEFSRQLRFNNGATTDDHAMHLVGYKEVDGKTWFLIKDSSSGSRSCGEKCDKFGYYFFHEDYVKLKMMSITIHKDAAKDLLKKLNK